MNTYRTFLKAAAASTILALSVGAFAQLGAGSNTDAAFEPLGGGADVFLHAGESVDYNGHTYHIPADLKLLEAAGKGPDTTPAGQKIVTMHGVKGIIKKREAWTFGLYPFTVFSVAGQVVRGSDSSFVGGTQSIVGSTISGTYSQLLNHGKSLELGGWYFRQYDNPQADLYQVDLRFFPQPFVGLQAAYIDSTTGNARSYSFHLVLQTLSRGASGQGNALHVEYGLGVLDDLTPQFNLSNGSFDRSATVNFSTYVDVSYELTKSLKLLATEWFIRDRNDDVNRFGLGISYQF